MNAFDNVKKNFGFGCMRLPLLDDGNVDYAHFSEMVDKFISEGFNYFDTAHGYLGGKSEIAIRECISKRYPREAFVLANKLSVNFFKTESDIRPFFYSQLENCGVEYFDFYLMHAQNASYYKKYTACRAYEIARELKEEGKIKHLAISFHDKASVLDMILTEHPEIEAVQIQFNYSDYEDESVESRKCYETCLKHGKNVIVMEPVRGGSLVNLPDEAQKIIDDLGGGSNASYAIRFAASFEGIKMVLSGMSNMEQMCDNISFMKDFKPFSKKEFSAINEIQKIFKKRNLIACTACKYCVEACPAGIPIPEIFSCMNKKNEHAGWNSDWYFEILTKNTGKPGDCLECGACEALCPQKLEIRKLLKKCDEALSKDD